MFKQLQEEHKEWAIRNFGKQDIEDYCLGLIEEVGELAHSVLKRKQGIRNNEHHDAMIRDAVGDITIYLVGYCNCAGIDMQAAYNMSRGVTISNVCRISRLTSRLLIEESQFEVTDLLSSLLGFSESEGIDFEQTVIDTWDGVVSTRDWINNPDCVSTTEAKKTIEDSGFATFDTKSLDIHLCDNCALIPRTCGPKSKTTCGDNIIACSDFIELFKGCPV